MDPHISTLRTLRFRTRRNIPLVYTFFLKERRNNTHLLGYTGYTYIPQGVYCFFSSKEEITIWLKYRILPTNIFSDDIEDKKTMLLFKIPNTKTNSPISFIINGEKGLPTFFIDVCLLITVKETVIYNR
ncbi:hypothetical protein NQ317_013698 [Molorchus minor]|uniref:Uncharacterized protein n=1 Tax=Molorchus minor TaxID=1323400 RepID=A0ABQ9JGE4_9CUCU|nr:hypothetical protein NQ317_013698 [Molorchus minor]